MGNPAIHPLLVDKWVPCFGRGNWTPCGAVLSLALPLHEVMGSCAATKIFSGPGGKKKIFRSKHLVVSCRLTADFKVQCS